MQCIKTMAIRITEDTYSIAVACLPPTFAQIGKDLVFGTYLVINALDTTVDENEQQVKLSLTNFWSTEELFLVEYDFVGPVRKTLFTEVVKMRNAELKDREPRDLYPDRKQEQLQAFRANVRRGY